MAQTSFTVDARDGKARRGMIETPRGAVRTPAFMPVGTAATVKAMMPESVMSLADLRKLTERGVTFKSHIDGSKHEITPERSMEIQRLLGSDIVMCFDECTPFPCTEAEALENQREESAKALREIGFDGYAVGGLAVGEGQQMMFDVLDYAPDMLPEDKPRYLMGVGKPDDIVGAVKRGIDMMDCVLPSRSGRTGQAWTRRGQVNIKNARHSDDPRPLDEDCTCPACSHYSRAYLHHVFRAGEMISGMLLTWHNLHYYQQLMQEMRDAIGTNTFADFEQGFHAKRAEGDIDPL
ncbi:Queuine tRNA-ribosyltransferase [Nymphon striatum]|nr:Queuine tRNA-ribosyltransferase [Nymphon striatum]